MRTSKTISGTVTNYSYNGSLLMAQVTGSGANQIKQLYSYDASGNLVSVNYNGTEYYYMRNGQNDIVGLMDNSGAVMVSYSYDAWGKSLTVSGTLATTLGQDNPFRYRGYYYDTETGLYYLQTRYYDATVCRFISADVYMSTGQGIVGNNMYAYCGNNPTTRDDDGGKFWNLVIGAVAGAAIGFIGSVASDLISGKSFSEVDWGKAGISAAIGAVSGLVAATGLGAVAQAGVSAGLSAADNAIGQIRDNGGTKGLKFDYLDCLGSAVIGGASSAFGSLIGGKSQAASAAKKFLSDAQNRINNGSIKRGFQIAGRAIEHINIKRGIASVAGTVLSGAGSIMKAIGKRIFR